AAITLEEGGDLEKDVPPSKFEIVVKRDESMDEGHYGKIVVAARRDHYIDHAVILISASLHNRELLRKTLVHELGHGFGLRDCPDCRSGATVMNYFSKQLVMGLKVHEGGSRIARQPTRCDIGQVAIGYAHGPSSDPSTDVGQESQDV